MKAEQSILDRIQRNQFEMVWTPPQNGRQSLAKEDLPVDPARQEKKRKTATIMAEPSDGLHGKQKHGIKQTFLAFGSGWTAPSCIDPNNKKNTRNENFCVLESFVHVPSYTVFGGGP